jgi:hypothetical protein
MEIFPYLISFVIGLVANFLYNRVRYKFGKPKIEICNYLLKTVKITKNDEIWPALQFKIINKTFTDIIDIKLSLRVVKFNDDDKVSKHILTITEQKIDLIKARELPFKEYIPFIENNKRTYPNAIIGKFFIPCEDIFQIIENKLEEGFNHIEIFIKATNPFTGSIYTNATTFSNENIYDYQYSFQLGHNCTPRKDENRKMKNIKFTKKELLNDCPFLK